MRLESFNNPAKPRAFGKKTSNSGSRHPTQSPKPSTLEVDDCLPSWLHSSLYLECRDLVYAISIFFPCLLGLLGIARSTSSRLNGSGEKYLCFGGRSLLGSREITI
ncbi:hypothetical protein L873DRAFT_306504 [Choiromyces venosus 120613-1]|uniref:Uncharacterized protein n=1 Tax=Choiromyces venosus 120613-1 TaxID=1336337 RepID=A0A3N4IZD7_9PEZI|nr:hypothetical protein L873DRAFT_306504 [Choiromyces venosus 120613-1]